MTYDGMISTATMTNPATSEAATPRTRRARKTGSKKAADKAQDRSLQVARRLIARIERGGDAPWIAPWDRGGGLPKNIVSKKSYSGFNTLMLWWVAAERGFASPWWMTLRQAHTRGGRVRRGQRSTYISTCWYAQVGSLNSAGEKRTESVPVERCIPLYNLEQLDGVAPPKTPRDRQNPIARDERIERWLASTRAPIAHGGTVACYSPRHDKILMPEVARFESSGAYYATLFHELVHYTAHESRIGRDLEGRFGDPSYAKEELIAEVGASFLCAEFAVPGDLRHAAYLGSWLEALNAEPRLLLRSAASAQTAIRFLNAVAEGRPTARFRRRRKRRAA
ncbi:MAG: DUF1738 domain-containing protein [Deltaproteobacteria bacterium]|nr:DUF1738 domain-containing protein [Deltaproteobacteria bacterium]